MTNQHPITPPPELVEQWEAETAHTTKDETWHVAVQAARWGADQELEACCKEVAWLESSEVAKRMRERRRPKPPSLKEQALEALSSKHVAVPPVLAATIRRALEALPDD